MPGEVQKITPIHYVPRFCSQCGGSLEKKFIAEENHERLVCPACGYIVYLNPQVVAGAVPCDRGKILLLRRGIEPARGAWTFPAGFVELGETVAEAAVRETKEETGVEIEVRGLLGVYSYSEFGVVTVVYLADVVGGLPQTSHEALEIREFSPDHIPWAELAFWSTKDALKDWVKTAGKPQ